LAFIPFAEPWSVDIEFGYMNLQRLHRMLLRAQAVLSCLASCPSGYINVGGTAGFSTDRNANKHYVEGDRHDRHDLVNQSSVLCSTKGVLGGITMSNMTTSPLLEQTKQINAVNSTTEYKTAVSISTCKSGIIVPFVTRAPEAFLSINQMRYISNPEHNQGLDNCTHAERCLPELNKLVAIVKEKNAVTHFASTWA
jgi:hypothetical protein